MAQSAAGSGRRSNGKLGKKKAPPITTGSGAPVGSLTTSLSGAGGARGPLAFLQDNALMDHMAHFDRERIPERVVHAKGAGAFGYFECTDDTGFVQSMCKAAPFARPGKRTPVAVRFSTVGGEAGSADTVRDPRGFAVKFYTEEGVWDLVGNNTPIFFLRDPILFPSFIHTQKRNPRTHLKDPDAFWDFISLCPQTTHQVSFLFGDRGIPNGYRYMNGYGSHTFKMVNADDEAVYVKFHLKTDQGIRNLSVEEAAALASSDPDFAIRDLFDAIERGDHPRWTMHVQVMTFEQAANLRFNPFDLTKVWPQSEFPLREVGRLVLDRNPQNYFAEVEQLAFSPAHLIPGIEASPDKMLQARLFSYGDTHRHRLGANYEQLPVNRSRGCPVQNYQRDGPACIFNQGSAPNYFPNSFGGPEPDTSAELNKVGSCPRGMGGGDVVRHDDSNDDNFTQVGDFFRNVLGPEERERLTSNIAGHLFDAKEFIQRRVVANFAAVDPDYGAMIARKLDDIRDSRCGSGGSGGGGGGRAAAAASVAASAATASPATAPAPQAPAASSTSEHTVEAAATAASVAVAEPTEAQLPRIPGVVAKESVSNL